MVIDRCIGIDIGVRGRPPQRFGAIEFMIIYYTVFEEIKRYQSVNY